jgi:hypothetical protein
VTLQDLVRYCEALPGALIPAHAVLEALQGAGSGVVEAGAGGTAEPTSWRERVHTCPAETVLDIRECAEATGRSVHAVRHLTRSRDRFGSPQTNPLPHHRVGTGTGSRLHFTAGDVRDWLARQAEPGITVIPLRRRRATR